MTLLRRPLEVQMAATTPAATPASEELCVPNKWAPGSFTDPIPLLRPLGRRVVGVLVASLVGPNDQDP